MMELLTERLKLIPCTKVSISMLSTSKEYEMGQHINMYLGELREDPTLLGWGVWFVIDQENNNIIGDIGFKGKPNSANTVEIGYAIVPSAQGKGYATEAVQKLVEWAFSNKNVTKIVAECLDDNAPSIRVLEKLQMKRIGSENNMLKWQLEK